MTDATPPPCPDAPLSPAGALRRDAMRADLTGRLVRRHRRRRVARPATLGAGLAVVALSAWVALRPGPSPRPDLAGGSNPIPPMPIPAPSGAPTPPAVALPLIEIVRTDAGVIDRFAPLPATSRIERLSDRDLLKVLHAIDRPAGLIEYGGRLRLTADVVDRPISAENRPDGTG